MKKLFLPIIFLFLIVSLSAFGLQNENLPKLEAPAPAVITFDNATANVNSSDYWDDLDVPTDIPNSEYWYNQSVETYNIWGINWSNHTKIIEDIWWNDFTSTYNSSYVPYTGATQNVDLGAYGLTTTGTITINTAGSGDNSLDIGQGGFIVGSTGDLNIGNLNLTSSQITDDSGTIDFVDDNLITTGDISATNIAGANANWDAAFTHISSTGASHTYINQNVGSGQDVNFGTITMVDNPKIKFYGQGHYLHIKPDGVVTADRILTLKMDNAHRTLTLSGNPTLGNWFNQGVATTSSPTFADVKTPAINSNTDQDLKLWENLIVDNAVNGRVLQVFRNATEGTGWVKIFVDNARQPSIDGSSTWYFYVSGTWRMALAATGALFRNDLTIREDLTVEKDVYVTGNATISENLALGTATLASNATYPVGNINMSGSLYYGGSLMAWSPHLLCSDNWCAILLPEHQKTYYVQKDDEWNILKLTNSQGDELDIQQLCLTYPIICGKIKKKLKRLRQDKIDYEDWSASKTVCEDDTHSYSSFSQHKAGNTTCYLDMEKVEMLERENKEKCTSQGEFYYWNTDTKVCEFDFKTECENIKYQYYDDDGTCKINLYFECLYQPTKSWNFQTRRCERDLEKECEAQQDMIYENGECIFNQEKQDKRLKAECLSDLSKYYDELTKKCLSASILK